MQCLIELSGRSTGLHGLRPAQYYRAATADGSIAFFIVFEREEKKLAVQGREGEKIPTDGISSTRPGRGWQGS
jgi:hypothetical protein